MFCFVLFCFLFFTGSLLCKVFGIQDNSKVIVLFAAAHFDKERQQFSMGTLRCGIYDISFTFLPFIVSFLALQLTDCV